MFISYLLSSLIYKQADFLPIVPGCFLNFFSWLPIAFLIQVIAVARPLSLNVIKENISGMRLLLPNYKVLLKMFHLKETPLLVSFELTKQ